MVKVEETQGLGLHCGGRGCAVVALVTAGLGLAVGLAYTLVARIYLYGYYSSAHVAGLTAFLAAFVLAHHLLRMRRALGCSQNCFVVLQCLLNAWSLLCCLGLAVGYTLLAVIPAHPSLDHVAAAAWGWAGFLIMLYLVAVCVAATRGRWYSSYDLATTRTSFVYHSAQDLPMKELSLKELENSTNSKTSLVTSPPKSSSCRQCCRGFWRGIFGLLYTLFHIIFAIVIFLSAFHPCAVFYDWKSYSFSDDLYTVKVGDHRPMSLFLKCRGSGNETIVYENGLGGMVYMEWDFLPRLLEDEFRVCLHDRRSYGWSQGQENDFVSLLKTDSQSPETSTEFFRALVKEADIPTPFYYAGHSYGGHHLAYTAALYPDLVKGLVFLDSTDFSIAGDYMKYLEAITNFFPTGLFRVALAFGLDISQVLDNVIRVDEMTSNTKQLLTAAFRSGDYFTALLREYRFIFQDIPEAYKGDGPYPNRLPKVLLQRLLKQSPPITKDVLVVDAGQRQEWFPEEHFERYNKSFSANVPGASHTGLVLSTQYANQTAQLIRAFIHLTQSKLTLGQFEQIKADIAAS